ncbi:MAG TPA: hypothetical protein ENK23_02995 [Sorangium sp.]|nr:hypothetical protein [Sorangium sp.]
MTNVRRKHHIAAIVVVCLLCSIATRALAEPSSSSKQDDVIFDGHASRPAAASGLADTDIDGAPPRYDWSIGAGIGGTSVVGIGGVGGLGAARSPLISAMVEHRLGKHVWLMTSLRGSYGASEQGGAGYGYHSRSRTISIGGDAGLRLVINPDDAFQFSGYAAAGYQWGRQRYEYSSAAQTQLEEIRHWNVNGRVGGAIERTLVDGIGVRLAVDLGRLSYGPTEHRLPSDGEFVRVDVYDAWDVGLALSPSLEARMKF